MQFVYFLLAFGSHLFVFGFEGLESKGEIVFVELVETEEVL